MSEGIEKLQRDLTVLEAMVAEMGDYLRSDVLFWPLVGGGLPQLTLGGCLLRLHRLEALADLLAEAERERLDSAVLLFNITTHEKVVRVEERANKELAARVRQWTESLKELKGDSLSYYQTAVEVRLMIAHLVHKLQTAPFQLTERILPQVEMLDRNLRGKWQSGEFIWPADWQPAYPRGEYWWLYGRPK